ncbi:MAG TPA: HAD-IA family hydrolase, partial [Reyranella sp.]|nr:HAD-IA family hydrolase [Reyranella sp.]
EDVQKAKPDPEIYTAAMARMGLAPKETLILEDNDHGIAAARASGAHVLVIGQKEDVNYDNIRRRIDEIRANAKASAA